MQIDNHHDADTTATTHSDALIYYYRNVYPASFMCSLLRRATGGTLASPECILMSTNDSATRSVNDRDVVSRLTPRSPLHLVRLLDGSELTTPSHDGLHARPLRRLASVAAASALDVRDELTYPFPVVVDYDMDDRTPLLRLCGCSRKSLCDLCWQAVACSVKLADWVLRRVHHFRSVLAVFSGNRGVHLHCYDAAAVNMCSAEREALLSDIAYPSLVLLPRAVRAFVAAPADQLATTNANTFIDSVLRVPSWWHDAYTQMVWPHFVQHWARVHGLDALDSGMYIHVVETLQREMNAREPAAQFAGGLCAREIHAFAAHCKHVFAHRQVLDFMSDSENTTESLVDELTCRHADRTLPQQRRRISVPPMQWRIDACLLALILLFVAPDDSVTLTNTHPIRQPFSPHSVSKRLALPFRAASAHLFQPQNDSPSVMALCRQRATHATLRPILDIAREALNGNTQTNDYLSNYE